ncbi:calmodulin-binding protein [Streptomyces sp. NBC_00829]|uniref:BP74-related protein n=1 Tax=Streptomyces sp. NBC_00829 TaxID=2903679 RepID=UPI003867F071|nr:calmodulin-binding protein [Streptomyces sp. NBC_00829]
MRRIMTRIGVLAAATIAAIPAAGTAQAQPVDAAAPRASASSEAYFEFTDVTRERFVFKLTDPAKIQEARNVLSGQRKGNNHIIGKIVASPASYNPGWKFTLDSDTVGFFDRAMEVCDATIPYVNEHLDEAGGSFLPGMTWCDWSSRLVREVPAPKAAQKPAR